MRKLGVLIAVVAVLALVPAASWADIAGSAHDFSSEGWNTTGQICIVCHTPHNALDTLVPLWNHATTATAAFDLYDSDTLDATPGQPAGVSLACLSCHDGTVAVDSYGGNTGTNFITGTAALGTDLSDDHPISFIWPTTDTGLNTPSGGTVGSLALPLYGAGGNEMECGSCHDVHDGPEVGMLLRASNAVSALCLNCHIK